MGSENSLLSSICTMRKVKHSQDLTATVTLCLFLLGSNTKMVIDSSQPGFHNASTSELTKTLETPHLPIHGELQQWSSMHNRVTLATDFMITELTNKTFSSLMLPFIFTFKNTYRKIEYKDV